MNLEERCQGIRAISKEMEDAFRLFRSNPTPERRNKLLALICDYEDAKLALKLYRKSGGE